MLINYPGEYPVVKWREAGLPKPSTIRASKRLNLITTDFENKIGRLHPVDILAVQKILSGK